MQVTEAQVQRSIHALTNDDGHHEPPGDARAGDVPAGLLEQLAQAAPLRDDRVAEVRRRMERGDQPSAEALAQRMVGRLVCDRLR
jgi:hypothetical protein